MGINVVKRAVCRLMCACLMAATGCGGIGKQLDVTIKPRPNPAAGPAVRIEQVHDKRYFAVDAPQPRTMCLTPHSDGDESLLPRGLGRIGDTNVLLPRGQTVAKLARQVLADAFLAAGFAVVGKSDPRYGQAIPVRAQIRRFWGWMRKGTWVVEYNYEMDLRVTAPVGKLGEGHYLSGKGAIKAQPFMGVRGIDAALHMAAGKLNSSLALALQAPSPPTAGGQPAATSP